MQRRIKLYFVSWPSPTEFQTGSLSIAHKSAFTTNFGSKRRKWHNISKTSQDFLAPTNEINAHFNIHPGLFGANISSKRRSWSTLPLIPFLYVSINVAQKHVSRRVCSDALLLLLWICFLGLFGEQGLSSELSFGRVWIQDWGSLQ